MVLSIFGVGWYIVCCFFCCFGFWSYYVDVGFYMFYVCVGIFDCVMEIDLDVYIYIKV